MTKGTLPQLQSSYSKITHLLYKSYLPKILNAAIEIGLFDTLSNRQMPLEKLADTMQTDSHVTEAVCDLLIEMELLEENEEGYRLTVMAQEFLVTDSPTNQLSDIGMYSGSSGPFDNLVDVLKGEKGSFDQNMWANQALSKRMSQWSKAGPLQAVIAFLKTLPEFETCKKMCDYAGNIGHFSDAITTENETLHAHVYELPEVVALANEMREKKATDRVHFHGFKGWETDDFGTGYDLFFVSNFMYEMGFKGTLIPFLEKVNRSMGMGGRFISNHISTETVGENRLITKIVELMTRTMGYATHHLPESILKDALSESGFGEFTTQYPDLSLPIPTLILSAKKIRDI